ncbi:MAG: protease modulator HflC [Rhizobiaceae bacterium]|nr:protease modulator HflC [Rhizobiaceae bacterium]
MGNRLPAIVIALVILAGLAYSSFFVVQAGEQAIVLRFGQIQSVKTEPGLYFKLPFGFIEADNIQVVQKRAIRFDLDDIRVQVSGGKFYEVDAFVVYKITNAERFRETVSGDVVSAESRLRTRLDSALRRVYGLRGFEAALSDSRAAMMTDVRDQLRPDAESLGLTIEDVRIRRTDLTKEVSQQTYERMKAERLAEAELIRARGREGGQRIRAIADRQVVELESKASRDSEITRGLGDAERNKIFAEAFSKDEDFFDFYRSMEAYRAALTDSDTTMVVSPNSEFFRFFRDAGGSVSAGTAAPNDQ